MRDRVDGGGTGAAVVVSLGGQGAAGGGHAGGGGGGGGHAAGGGDGGEQGLGLVAALEVLVLGDRVDHDAGAGSDRRPTVGLHDHRPNGDRRVEVPGEIDVADDACVRAALHRFEIVDDLHGPHLRCA